MKKWIFNNICVQSGKEKGCYCSTNYDFAILIDLSPKKVPSSNCQLIISLLSFVVSNKETKPTEQLSIIKELPWDCSLGDFFSAQLISDRREGLMLMKVCFPWFLTAKTKTKKMIYHDKKGLMLMSGCLPACEESSKVFTRIANHCSGATGVSFSHNKWSLLSFVVQDIMF